MMIIIRSRMAVYRFEPRFRVVFDRLMALVRWWWRGRRWSRVVIVGLQDLVSLCCYCLTGNERRSSLLPVFICFTLSVCPSVSPCLSVHLSVCLCISIGLIFGRCCFVCCSRSIQQQQQRSHSHCIASHQSLLIPCYRWNLILIACCASINSPLTKNALTKKKHTKKNTKKNRKHKAKRKENDGEG